MSLTKRLSTTINERVDVPLIPEGMEQTFFEAIVGAIVPSLPPEVIPFLEDGVDGFTDVERDSWEAAIESSVIARIIVESPAIVRPFVKGYVSTLVAPVIGYIMDLAQGLLPPPTE